MEVRPRKTSSAKHCLRTINRKSSADDGGGGLRDGDARLLCEIEEKDRT